MSNIAYRFASLSLVSALAFGLATSANAQLLTHKDLSLAMATTIAQTAIATCKAQGYNVSVHVLGREGQVIVAAAQRRRRPRHLENSMKKAYTARTFGRTSGEFAEGVKGNPNAGALFLTNIMPAQGALPIKVGNDTDRRRRRFRRTGRREGRGLRQGRHRQGAADLK